MPDVCRAATSSMPGPLTGRPPMGQVVYYLSIMFASLPEDRVVLSLVNPQQSFVLPV